MSQEQNNNKQKMDAPEELEFSSEDYEELEKEIEKDKKEEDEMWKCYNDIYEKKKNQYNTTNKNYERIHKNQFKGKNKLELYKQSYIESLRYYGNLKDYLLLAEMDNSNATMKYNYYKKMFARLTAFIEMKYTIKKDSKTTEKEHPTWEEWCEFNNKRKTRKAEEKRKEENKPKKNN